MFQIIKIECEFEIILINNDFFANNCKYEFIIFDASFSTIINNSEGIFKFFLDIRAFLNIILKLFVSSSLLKLPSPFLFINLKVLSISFDSSVCGILRKIIAITPSCN